MKTLQTFSFLPIFIVFVTLGLPNNSFGQKTTTESIPVSGNCGMCKSTIEKAATKAGATTATWNKETKVLTIKYNSSTTNTAKIEESIAAAGYDTRDFKATDDAYNKLHACCQYDRTADAGTKSGDNGKMDCCKDGKCSKPGHNGKDCCKKS